MAVYVTRGLFCLAVGYCVKEMFPLGIFPSVLASSQKVTAPGPVLDFINRQAAHLGLKNFIVIKTGGFFAYGNTLFGLKGISVWDKLDLTVEPSEKNLFWLTHTLAHLKSNDMSCVAIVPIITALFTAMLLNSKSPVIAPVAGMAAGLTSFVLYWRWREKTADITALQHCSKAVNQAYLTYLKEEKGLIFSSIWERLIEPSLPQRIQYFQAFIEKQAD